MGNRIEYEISRFAPRADAGYSGNPLDPAKVSINKALGRYGAVPPYFIPRGKDIITQVYDANEITEDSNYAWDTVKQVIDADKILQRYAETGVVHSQMPMRIRRSGESEWYTLPFEPLVSISCKNIITRRTVAKSKSKGTIKENWTQDDYEVTISGLAADSAGTAYPEREIRRLLGLFNEKQSVEVDQEILMVFSIKYLSIESASFPHTKGLGNQNYDIKAYSDNPVSLFIPI